jgi:hypothetical protein
MAAPKPDGTFRVVHQIDPLNAISFTAMACMVGDAIEESRQRAEDRIACSYRIKLDRMAGRFISEDNGSGAELATAA